MLEIKNLHVEVEGKKIINGLNLTINDGEVHAIMGPNGSGKSTLASVIAGNDTYEVTEGSITYNGIDLLELDPDQRAHLGVFLSFQYPVELPGVNNHYFLRTALNSIRKARGEEELDALEFYESLQEKMKRVKMDSAFLKRSVNEGFSGGEKKRNEILQMLVLEPTLAILDETDSGLDIDALRVIADGINGLRDNNRSFLMITHYQRLLNYVQPDVVHVMTDGEIVKTGGKELALELEQEGYVAYRGDNVGGSRKDQ
ncbi:Fe-S cluster assembly ATPase SufC [Ignatzschineria sp. RMDPL8A]|uniref:Fe-S cluster assembly ATPase SufC n=1 Tax=Ignatzschineria sp. RMDPL8A TaxID=2999236 RepID=UPI00168E8D0E|nr:Fe-S cluster assembly ATPase SufC [Ignatzschineria sp. RMDPL8A]MDG9729186.1 Fe-S cluster assembly ATPase SufC [Ignatzschineria sp. RMDPL8A]NLD09948.1 Fe-S cluster assembly ATPase SufC [Xanthomonadaceae bacterium]